MIRSTTLSLSSIRDISEGLKRAVLYLHRCGLTTFLLPFTIYLLTLAPTIYNLDSAELSTAVATGGILRATGYPLYLALGKLWSWLPVGDIGYRLNLFSAFCGAGTIFLADRILQRLNAGGWARFGALGLLATAPYFWSLSLIAEVYTLHTLLMSGIILALMRWQEAPSPARFAAAAGLLALSMGNHAATALLVPGAAWYLLSTRPRSLLQPRMLVAGLAAGLLGISIYLYLPLRFAAGPAFNYAGTYNPDGKFSPVDLQTLEGMWWLVSGKAFSGQMFGYSLPEIGPQVLGFGRQLWEAFFALGVLPGLVGTAAVFKRSRQLGVMLALMFFANVLFYINYRVVDKATMYLPAYLVWAVWLGAGYQVLLNWLKAEGKLAGRLARAIMITIVVAAGAWNWQRVDLSNDYSTREQSEAILSAIEPGGMFFGWWDTVPAIQYLQLVEGQRPDVTAINRFLINGRDMNALILNEISHRPVYIDNPSVALLRETRVTRVNTMYRLEARR